MVIGAGFGGISAAALLSNEDFDVTVLEKNEQPSGRVRAGEPILDARTRKVLKRIYCVDDFKNDYNAYKGTALCLVHTLRQTVLLRPSHSSKKVKNLYYTGHYTHPGIGMPMTIISSQILSKTISDKYGK